MPPAYRWSLVWSDEFNGPTGSSVDATKWTAEVGGGGWGNNELEYYTTRTANSYQSDGCWSLKQSGTLHRVRHVTRDYTSARLITRNKFSPPYGRLEARISCLWPGYLACFLDAW